MGNSERKAAPYVYLLQQQHHAVQNSSRFQVLEDDDSHFLKDYSTKEKENLSNKGHWLHPQGESNAKNTNAPESSSRDGKGKHIFKALSNLDGDSDIPEEELLASCLYSITN